MSFLCRCCDQGSTSCRRIALCSVAGEIRSVKEYHRVLFVTEDGFMREWPNLIGEEFGMFAVIRQAYSAGNGETL